VKNLDKQMRKKLQSMTIDQAKQFLVDELPGLHADELMGELFQELRENVQSKDGDDQLSAFLSSYNTIHP